MTQRIVTIIGDSIALPRPEDRLYERDLYPARLQQLLGPDSYVVNRSSPSNHAARAVYEETTVYAIRGTQADCYVIQFGIVDCAPRLFTAAEKEVLSTLMYSGIFRLVARAWIAHRSRRRYEHTKERQILQTTPEDFALCYRTLIDTIRSLSPAKKIVAVNIAAAGPAMTERSYGVAESIERFNAIIRDAANEHSDIVEILDIYGPTKSDLSLLLPDGHHLTATGHALVADRLARLVRES